VSAILNAEQIALLRQQVAPGNPLAPYVWESEYQGGLRVPGWTGDRWLRTDELDRTQIVALHVLGLPCGPVRIDKGPGVPDRILVQATWRATWGGAGPRQRRVGLAVGFVHGASFHGVKVDPAGMDQGAFPWPS
jgi:hypothetical protein